MTKKRSRRYPVKTITEADYADDMAILADTPAQAKTLPHSNADKTEYMFFNQTGDISTLGGSSLKLVDKFIYLGSSVSSTEKDIDTRLTKAWIFRAILNKSKKQHPTKLQLYLPLRKLSKLDEPDTQHIAGEAGTSS